MNSIDFCYWLQGYFEISEADILDAKKTEIIKNHLNLVFKHEIDGIYEKNKLQNIHDGKTHTSPNDGLVRC